MSSAEDDEGRPVTVPRLGELSADKVIGFGSNLHWGLTDPARFMRLMEEAKSLVTGGYFLGDNLFTWVRNNSALEDAAFRTAWQSNIRSASDEAIVWRRYILACAAFHCVQLQGDFVECGAYVGSGIKTVIDYLGGAAFPRVFWGYDTFDYHPAHERAAAFEEHGPELYDKVRARFAAYPQVRLVRGLLPGSLTEGPHSVSYLHIDLNDAAAEIGVLDALFDKVTSGGIVILDDYEWSSYREQKRLEDPWFDERRYRVFPLPTGQGLVIKR